MINTLYEFTYLPLSWQVASIASVVLLITWFQWPSIILTILTGGLLWLYGVDAQIALFVMVPTVLLTVPLLFDHKLFHDLL